METTVHNGILIPGVSESDLDSAWASPRAARVALGWGFSADTDTFFHLELAIVAAHHLEDL
jgi:hypothetical protein